VAKSLELDLIDIPGRPQTTAGPFHYLDRKLAEFQTDRERARKELKACGWILRPNHPIAMTWRARRKGQHLSAATVDALIELAKAEAAPRFAAQEERRKLAAIRKARRKCAKCGHLEIRHGGAACDVRRAYCRKPAVLRCGCATFEAKTA
jgi:hypothetical protein